MTKDYFILFAIISTFSVVLPAQDQSRVDSLSTLLPGSEDVQRINLLIELAAETKYLDPSQSRAYAQECLEIANQLYSYSQSKLHLNAIGDAHKHIAVSYSIQGKNTEALDHGTKALEIYQTSGDLRDLTEINNSLGIVYDQMGQMDEALAYYLQAEKAGKAWGNLDRLSGIYNNIGYVYQTKSAYQTALNYYQQSLDLAKQANSEEGMGYAYYNIAVIHDYLGEFEESLRLFYLSLGLREKLNNQYDISASLNSIAIMYNKMGDSDKALEYHQKSLAIKQELGHSIGQANSYLNIGNIYSKRLQIDEAIQYYMQALQLQDEAGDKLGLSKSHQFLAEAYRKQNKWVLAQENYDKSLLLKKELEDQYGEANLLIGLATLYADQGRFSQAKTKLKQSLEVSEQIGAQELTKMAYQSLSTIYERSGDFKQALVFHQAYSSLQDSLFKTSMSEQIAEMNTKYESEKKEQTITAQNNEIVFLEQKQIYNRNFRYALMLIGVLLLITALVIFNRYRMKHRAERILRVKNEEIEQKNAEIEEINSELEKRMLRAQMDPHFVFNSLNSIQHFITINDKDSALKYLSKFSKLIRQVLENSVNQSVPIADEIKLLENYIQLEALRLDHKFDYAIDIDPNLDTLETEIPFLLIQPYVENSIVHGLRHLSGNGHLKVSLSKQAEYLHCTVEDNGVGRNRSREIEQSKRVYTSHGMPITAKRLELLNKGKVNKTTVSVQDLWGEQKQPIGTKVDIEIPLEST